MKTTITTVYTFDELSDAAKIKAREWYKEGDDMPFLEEYMNELLTDLLAQNKIEAEEAKVMYSLSYCQGDGAMFAGVFEFKGNNVSVKQSGHYYHSNSKVIDWPDFVGEDKETTENAIADEFEAIYTKICRELEKQGYNYIEQERSNENVDDNILNNEYTFTETGKRFG
ncbi:MAG: hypothetical protein V4436_02060 [Patescibacteria group bacterium]